MTDRDLARLLERSADHIQVGPAPLQDMMAAEHRLRRRRSLGRLVLVAAAVGVIVGATAVVSGLDTTPGFGPADRGASSPSAELVPPGTRLVGVGHAAIAVPESWGTNALHCGTATEPTVVIDVGAIETCAWLSPRVFDNVWVERGVNASMFTPSEDFDLDGVAAQRDTPACTQPRAETQLCVGTVFLPSEDVSFRAQAATTQRVDEMLSWILISPDLVAVPGFAYANIDHQDDDAGEHYRTDLRAAGLDVEVRTEPRPGFKAGYVLAVDPRPGTMVEPGQIVTMTEIAEPTGPAEELNVEVNSVGPGDSMDYRGLSDAQIRAGAQIRIDLGATIWVFGHGKRASTLAGALAGPALTKDDWKQGPNYGRSWKAIARGSSTLTITITANGRQITLGTVNVTVQ